MVRNPMEVRPLAPQGTSDRWMWAAVLGATALVVGLAVLKGDPGIKPDGHPAPKVSLPLLDGKGTASLAAGKITVVDFWATWCAPCRESMPRVQKVWQEYQPKGVELYSVDTDNASSDREPMVKEFLLKNGLTFPVVLDDGSAQSAYAVSNLPTMVVVDQRGRVVWSHIGALTPAYESDLRGVLDRTLARTGL